jgi:hypothetical protein
MATMALAAVLLGAVLGLRFSAWALLPCLSATVLTMSGVMLLSAVPFFSTAAATFLAVSGMQIGYLAGSYAAETGIVRSSLRSASSVVNQ